MAHNCLRNALAMVAGLTERLPSETAREADKLDR
jgi:hypothetical protein